MKYKNFMPSDYLEKLESRRNKFFEKLILLLILINIILLPKSIERIYSMNESIEVVNLEVDLIDHYRGELLEIMDLINLDIEYLEIRDGKGSIIIRNKEDIYKVDKYLNIKSIEKDEKNYYLLGVELWKRRFLEVL